jgi:hypothetical protein
MKKQFALIVCLIAFAFSSIAQESMYLPVILKNDDGTAGSYYIKKDDKLVYQVNAGSNQYDFIVTVNSGNSKGALDFNYEMTNSRNTKGHVLISADARNNATKYINYFGGGELNLTNAITVWLSNKNFGDIAKKKTTMQIDNNSSETFYRPEKDEATLIVKIKGEDKKLDAFIINNAVDGNGDKTMWINALAGNTLIVKMNLGFSIVLKEIK